MSRELKSIGKLKAISEDTIDMDLNECYLDNQPTNNTSIVRNSRKNSRFRAESTIELSLNKCYTADNLPCAILELGNEEQTGDNDNLEESYTSKSGHNSCTLDRATAVSTQPTVGEDDKNYTEIYQSIIDSKKSQEDEEIRQKKDDRLVNKTCRTMKTLLAMIATIIVSLLVTIIVVTVAYVEIANIKDACKIALNEENQTQSESPNSMAETVNITAFWNETSVLPENWNETESQDEIPFLNLTQLENKFSNLAKLFSYPVLPYSHQAHALIFNSCSDVLSLSLPSGYYLVRTASETVVSMYCDMTLSCGGRNGGWTRVAKMDFNNPTTPCPHGFLKANFKALSCARYHSDPGCSLITAPAQDIPYSRICGRVIGIQSGYPDGFAQYNSRSEIYGYPRDLNSTYLDGVSITHGQFTHHIWSLVAVYLNDRHKCSCAAGVPSYVNSDYSCDTEFGVGNHSLWDGLGCSSPHNHEWFYRDLPYSTSDDIEVRLCRDEPRWHEDVLLQRIELYVQ